MSDLNVARTLGWVSLAIGATEFAAPGWLERKLGVSNHRGLMKLLGIREALSGVSILSQKKATSQLAAGLWSRVVGDGMDLALLLAAAKKSRKPAALIAAIAMVAGITLMDLLAAERMQKHHAAHSRVSSS